MTTAIRAIAGVFALAVAAAPAIAQGAPLGTPIPGKPLGTRIDEPTGPPAFLANQLSYARVAEAKATTDDRLRALFAEKGVVYPAPEIFLRVFKYERVLELWGRSEPEERFRLLKAYPVCAMPGQLGPKRQMGDVQVPEGFYFIDEFNPNSAYHLSLRVNYPNLADRMRREALSLGGDIYIHGGCETVGCVPIENQNIEEVYWLAAQAMDAGQKVIPVHIFPARLDPERLEWLRTTYQPEADLLEFWQDLADGYAYFEQTHHVPWITVAADGRYDIPDRPRLAGPAAAPGGRAGATDPHGDPAAADSAFAPASADFPDAAGAAPGDSAGVPATDSRAEAADADTTAAVPPGGPLGVPVIEPAVEPAVEPNSAVSADTLETGAPVTEPADTLPRGPVRPSRPDTTGAAEPGGTGGERGAGAESIRP